MNKKPDTIATETQPKSYKKHIIIGILILIPLLLFTAWWSATVMGERAIQAQLAEYRAAGQPVDAKDFRTPGLPDDENNVLLLDHAADALWLESDDNEYFGVSYNRLIIAKNISSFEELISKNEKTFELLDKALAAPAGDWQLTFTMEDWNGRLFFNNHRMLVKFICSSAIRNHINGNDAAAVRNLLRAYDAAQISRTCPTMIGQFVAIADEARVCVIMEQTVYDLQIAPADANGVGRAASREDVKALISKLLDIASLKKHSTRSLLGERRFLLNMCRLIERGKGEAAWINKPTWVFKLMPLLRPAVKQDTLIVLDQYTSLSEATSKSNFPDAAAALPPELELSGWWNDLLHPLHDESDFPSSHVLGLYFRGRARRVMAATALAIRLYEIDHGRRPGKLADLVPDYLDAVPDDPFAKSGTPIGYLPNAPRPLLYSIGANGIDEHGTYAADPNDPPAFALDKYDEPFFLNGDDPSYEKEFKDYEENKAEQKLLDEELSDEELFDEERLNEEPTTQPAAAPAMSSD